MQLTSEWAKTFAKSDKVDHKKSLSIKHFRRNTSPLRHRYAQRAAMEQGHTQVILKYRYLAAYSADRDPHMFDCGGKATTFNHA